MRRTYERLWTLDSKFVTVETWTRIQMITFWFVGRSGNQVDPKIISSLSHLQYALSPNCNLHLTQRMKLYILSTRHTLPYKWVIQIGSRLKHSIVPLQSIKFSYLHSIDIEKCSDSPASSPSYHAWAHSCPRQLLAPAHPLVWWLLRACQDLYHSARSQRTLTAWL